MASKIATKIIRLIENSKPRKAITRSIVEGMHIHAHGQLAAKRAEMTKAIIENAQCKAYEEYDEYDDMDPELQKAIDWVVDHDEMDFMDACLKASKEFGVDPDDIEDYFDSEEDDELDEEGEELPKEIEKVKEGLVAFPGEKEGTPIPDKISEQIVTLYHKLNEENRRAMIALLRTREGFNQIREFVVQQ